MKIKIVVSYDGTNYCGWQVQPGKDTVQRQLELALTAVTGEKKRVTGSGRTDAGVHAKGQVAHFTTETKTVKPENFYRALNAHLPFDIRVIQSELASDDFQACRSAKKKTYSYNAYLSCVEKPLKERFAVRFDHRLNVEKMQQATSLFLGEHDFKGFCASRSGAKTSVRTIYDFKLIKKGEDLTFLITGNGFLYNMVRIIVGTIVEVGRDKLSIEQLKALIDGGDRADGGRTLPARGLCLENVEY